MSKITNSKNTTVKMPLTSILLDGAYYDFDLFTEHFKKNWNFPDIMPYRDQNNFGLIAEGMVIGCKFIPAPITEPALMQSARDSILWNNAESCVSRHNAHITVALAREKDPVSSHILLTKFIYSLLHQRNACGIYFHPGLFEPTYYINSAEALFLDKLATELWVQINYIGLEQNENISFYTSGMKKFGKKEFEIVETTLDYFIDAYHSLKDLIQFTIENNMDLNGGGISYPDSQSLFLISDGVHVEGESIKINPQLFKVSKYADII